MTTNPPVPHIKEAPESALPALLVEPPWARPGTPRPTEPVVLKLRAPKEPTVLSWAPGQREKWLQEPYDDRGPDPLPEDTDWAELAKTFSSGAALELRGMEFMTPAVGLLMQAPPEYGRELLADERYLTPLSLRLTVGGIRGAVARHELAAQPLALETAAKRGGICAALEPFLDVPTAQAMIKHYGGLDVKAWCRRHGSAAARLVIPDALRKPGPKRNRAVWVLRSIAEAHGGEAVVEAARYYGEEAAEAIAAMRLAPLDLYPDPLPQVPEEFAPERLPQVLLRGGDLALPAAATRNLIIMVLISELWEPYAGLTQVVPHLDPGSLAEFAWALYQADKGGGQWASPGVEHALVHWGDDRTAARLASVIARWPNWYTWERKGHAALHLFDRLGTDGALRHLHRLATKAKDHKHIRPRAEQLLQRAAKERGLSPQQLADRLVPDFGLDAQGGMTLDYGRRRFRVGFDEQLKPYVTDEDGKRRATLPKPGVRDDQETAGAAYQRFTELKKEVKTVAAEQIGRLEQAMVSGRSWTAEEFGALFVEHPLLCHIARRLVWQATADGRATAFRVAEDRTLADVDEEEFTLPDDALVTLPHPILLGEDAVRAWTRVLADYQILQPFPQLGRVVHTLEADERQAARLTRFEGRRTHFGRVLGLTRRGWRLEDKETGGFRRQVTFLTPQGRHLAVFLDPGVRVFSPEEYPEQTLTQVVLWDGRWSGREYPFGELDPVTCSELLADLIALTAPADGG